MMMTGAAVVTMLACLRQAGIPTWLDRGWGVDALLGRQTRPHSDLDTVVPLDRTDEVIACLEPFGFGVMVDERPTRFVLADDEGCHIDFHPIVVDGKGNGRQIGAGPNAGDAIYPAAGLTGEGMIEGERVSCLTPDLLLRHHTGYEPQDKDRHNVRLLCERFGLALPRAYRVTAREETGA
jgi:lincosamide nucleotidyltransferase A/C/D/E